MMLVEFLDSNDLDSTVAHAQPERRRSRSGSDLGSANGGCGRAASARGWVALEEEEGAIWAWETAAVVVVAVAAPRR